MRIFPVLRFGDINQNGFVDLILVLNIEDNLKIKILLNKDCKD